MNANTAQVLARAGLSSLSEDEQDLINYVRSYLDSTAPRDGLVNRLDDGDTADFSVFQRICTNMDLLSMGLPQSLGGAGASQRTMGLVLRELGRALAAGAFLPAMLALQTLADCKQQLPTDLTSGKRLSVLAGLPWNGGLTISATQISESTWQMTGKLHHVEFGAQADEFIVFAKGPEGPVILHVTDLSEVDATPVETLDRSRPMATLEFTGVKGVTIVDGSKETSGIIKQAKLRSAMGVAAEQVGVAEQSLEIMVTHAQVRKQFDKPIGSFQAIKHRCANAALTTEAARSMLLSMPEEPSSHQISLIKPICVEASIEVTQSLIQVLGGIGYTWEHVAHFYLKRAISSRYLAGSTEHHRAAVAEQLLTTK